MSNDLVIRSDAAGLATLTLNRPDKLNALTPQLFVQLRAHIDAIANQIKGVGFEFFRYSESRQLALITRCQKLRDAQCLATTMPLSSQTHRSAAPRMR